MRGNLTKRVPKTIDDLKNYCKERNLNSDVTRFYIDVDHIGPDAYGIYKDYWSDDFIVYKNKEDGSRMIIYQGKDEAYAVNELGRRLSMSLRHPEMLTNLDLQEGQEDAAENELSSGTSFVSTLRSEHENEEEANLESGNGATDTSKTGDLLHDQKDEALKPDEKTRKNDIENQTENLQKNEVNRPNEKLQKNEVKIPAEKLQSNEVKIPNEKLQSNEVKIPTEKIQKTSVRKNDEDSINDHPVIDQDNDADRYGEYHYDLFPKEYTINKKKPNKDKLEMIKVALLFIIAIMAIIFFGLYSVTNGFTNTDRDNYNNAYYDSYYKSYFSSDNYDCADLPGPMNGSYYTPEETHYLAEQIEKRWSERFR